MLWARGTQVGSRQIIPIPATACDGVRLTVQESAAPVTIVSCPSSTSTVRAQVA